jgi:uncharacterized protein
MIRDTPCLVHSPGRTTCGKAHEFHPSDDGKSPLCTKVAGTLHTAFVLAFLVAMALLSYIDANHAKASVVPDRIRFYSEGIVFEWLLFAFIAWGVRRSGAPLILILGDRWHSALQVLRDVGIAAAFWTVSIFVLTVLGFLLRINSTSRSLNYMFPRGKVELFLWIILSISAGFCEEVIFRGYLQRQLMAMTKSATAGILISAVAFGAGHIYQGPRRALLLVVYGAGFGVLAYWRGSIRPGILAHTWHDTLLGIMANASRR